MMMFVVVKGVHFRWCCEPIGEGQSGVLGGFSGYHKQEKDTCA